VRHVVWVVSVTIAFMAGILLAPRLRSQPAPHSPEQRSNETQVAERLRREREMLEKAPPAPEMLTSALHKGTISRNEIEAFHQRLDELPSEQRPILLRTFQMAINDRKIRLLP
jgi:hypothetical protein